MPRAYYPRIGVNPWTAEQKEKLERMAIARQPWDDIATECGHPKSSCQSTLSYLRRQRKLAKGEPIRSYHKAGTPYVAPLPPTGRHRRMSTLVQDAELRARIEILGATGGLLGDPLPGRSALDQKQSQHGVLRSTSAPSASASGAAPARDADAIFMDGAT